MSYAKLGMAAVGAAAAYGMSRGRGRRDEGNFELGRSQAYSDAFGGGAPGIRELHRMLKDIESGGMSFDPSLAEGYKHEAKRILAAAGGKPSISLQEYHDWEDAGGRAARGRRAEGRLRVYKNIETLRKAASHGDVNLDNLMTGRFRHKDEGWVSFRLKSYRGIPQGIAEVLGGRDDTQRHVTATVVELLMAARFPDKDAPPSPISSSTAERIVYSKYGKWPARWEYVAGQDYPAETARIRKALTR